MSQITRERMKVISSLLFLFCCAACCRAQVESLKIGRGDELQIKVLEAPELGQNARVNDAGTIALLLGGDVQVAGLTPVEAAHAVERVLVDGHYVLTPHVNVAFALTVTQNVSVMGQVRAPGSYPIGTPRPVLDVLALAGGLTDLANRRVTIQRHASKDRIEFVLSNSPDAALDGSVSIFPGDTLIVPKADVVYILGDVGRPGGIAMVYQRFEALCIAGAFARRRHPSERGSRPMPD